MPDSCSNAQWLSGWAFPPDALQPIRQQVERERGAALPVGLRVGWSLGGLRILHNLFAQDDRVSHLVLLSSTLRFCREGDTWPGVPRAELRALQRRLAREPQTALEEFHRLCGADQNLAPDLLARRVSASLALGVPALAAGLRDLAEMDFRADGPTIRQPTLIVHGARDRVIPVDAARRMAQCLPMASYGEHPEAGHDVPLTDTRWVAGQIVAFLRRHP